MKNEIRQSGHVLHLVIGSVAVALLTVSFIVDLCNLPMTTHEPSIPVARASFVLIGLGLIAMILGFIPGLVDYSLARAGSPMEHTARRHFWINVLAFLLFAGEFLARWVFPSREGPALVPIILSFFGLGFLWFGGYLGMQLHYHIPDNIPTPEDELAPSRNVLTHPAGNTSPSGAAVDKEWKKVEADAQRWRVEPRVDADGDTI